MEAVREGVAVIGAGPAGAMAAFLLAAKGQSVVLLDDGRPSSDRVEMLPPRAAMAFRAGGLGHVLDDPAIAVPCSGIMRSGAVEDRQDFLMQPGGHGFAVGRPGFDAAIRMAAFAAGARRLSGRLVGVSGEGNSFTVLIATTDGPARISARTIIDASGRGAAAARRLGAKTVTHQRLLAVRRSPEEAAGSWLSFMSEGLGWHYTITGPRGRRDSWRITAPHPLPAGSDRVDASARWLSPAAGRRWIAIGDAASAFDPICCQGLAHAASSALAAAGMIMQSGTVLEGAAEIYDMACRDTAALTEAERRAVYVQMALPDDRTSERGAPGALATDASLRERSTV